MPQQIDDALDVGNDTLYTSNVSPQHMIQVVTSDRFRAIAEERRLSTYSGRHFLSAKDDARGKTVIYIANRFPPRREQIDRDNAWSRRLELASLLEKELGDEILFNPMDLHHRIPLSLLSPLYMPAFAGEATQDNVMRAFTSNSQQRFETTVASYLEGRTLYQLAPYSQHGPAHARYSHIEHLGWIYFQQIRLTFQLLEAHPIHKITVIDLGTGGAHFLITLGQLLSERNQLHQVRLIGVDNSDRDTKYAQEIAKQRALDITFLNEDVNTPAFQDRLRQLVPDVVVANHIIEHLDGEIQNRHLQNWLLAARYALSISVPIKDNPRSSISDHTDVYDPKRVADLARSMELRVGYAIAAEDIDETQYGGLIKWVKTPEVRERGGFAGRVFILRPNVIEVKDEPILDDFGKPFDPTEFATKPRRAPIIGKIQDKAKFQEQGNEPRQIRQLVVKAPGTAVIVPCEFEQLQEPIQRIIDHNKAANPDYDRSYAYLNVFRGKTKFDSYRGLSLNCHGDQLQTLREGYAFKPDWSYITSNTLPTILFAQAFDLSDAVAKARAGENVNLYEYMNKQADKARAYLSENYAIYLLSPYVVHSASDAQEDVFRVFMKIAFSTKRFFDNRELRWNPAFDIESWYQHDTVGYIGGFFSHAHWNERFLVEDVCLGWSYESC